MSYKFFDGRLSVKIAPSPGELWVCEITGFATLAPAELPGFLFYNNLRLLAPFFARQYLVSSLYFKGQLI